MVNPVSNRTKEVGGGGDILGHIDELDDTKTWAVNQHGATTTVPINGNVISMPNSSVNNSIINNGKVTINGNELILGNHSDITMTNNKVVTRGGAKASVAAKPKRPATTKKSTKKDFLADPRLKDFMERSKYEAFEDPYRGIFPYFQVSFSGSTEKNDTNEASSFTVGEHVFVDSNHPAVIASIDEEEKTAVIKWSTTQKEETVSLNQINPMDSGKTRSGRSSITDAADTRRLNESAMYFEEKPSPWARCSDTLNPNSWKYTNPRSGAEIISLDDTEEVNEKKTILVKCNCCSINEWAESGWETSEKERIAASKKNKKGKKGKKKKEVVIIDSDDEQQQAESKQDAADEQKDEIICGRRGDQECACDYNPFCLASIGGIFDEYRYNVAKTKQMLEGPNATISEADFASVLRENWTEIPKVDKKKCSKQDAKNELKHFRSSIKIPKENVQTHMLRNITTSNEGELSAESCMEILLNHHKLLIFPSMQLNLTECNSNIQLSKPPGLKNLGATCYLNSQLQCLAQNLGFMHGLLSWKPTMPTSDDHRILATAKRMNDVLSSMQSILARMRYGHESTICTNEFSVALGLENDEMQDPNEFAGLLFDRMQDSFKQCADISGQTQLRKLLPSIYWGKSSITTKCSGCGYSSKRTEEFKFVSIPIVECDEGTAEHRPNGVSKDVDVQQLLKMSLEPEHLIGENQYSCSGCGNKCDATRTPCFEDLPPVLNLQLTRYVFNMTSFSKEKLKTKVLLPRILQIPVQNESKSYVLVAVQNHLGNSAHGGHYTANAMDWATGVWYEFNDEDVDVLEHGPLSGYYRDEDTKSRAISGSADAYNLLYVEKSYLSTITITDLSYCKDGDAKVTRAEKNSTDFEQDTYQLYSKMRIEHFQIEQEEHGNQTRKKKRLEYRKKQLIEQFCSNPDALWFEYPNKCSSDNALIESKVLMRFFSCTDGLEDLFKGAEGSIIDNKSLLCEHGVGVHPRTAAKLKLLSNKMYDIFSRILNKEYEMFTSDETPTDMIRAIKTCNLELKEGDAMLVCEKCSMFHQLELKNKFELTENLIELYQDLRSEANDLGIADDTTDACAVSKRFITLFCKYVEGLDKSLFGQARSAPGDLFSVDLSELLGDSTSNKKSASETELKDNDPLDTQVNSRITCEHGNCNVMHNKRSTQIVPRSVWKQIIRVFPSAIQHEYQPPSDECIGNCRDCQREKESAELFPIKIKEWKSNINDNPLLQTILKNEYEPSIDNENRFGLFHHNQVQGWRDTYSYLSRSKKNVSMETIKAKLRQLCSSSPSLLICEEHKMTVIPNFSPNMNLKDGNLEWFMEEHCNTLLSSMAALRDLLQEKEDSSTSENEIKPPLALVDGDQKLVYVEPDHCVNGCVCSISNIESDLEKGQCEVHVVDDTEEDKPEEKGDPMFHLCVHEVEGNMDVEVAVSTITMELSADTSQDPPTQRRSRRKKKEQSFPSYSVSVPRDCNIAHLRLILHEQIGKRLLRQCLHLIRTTANGQNSTIELSENDNSKDFCEYIADEEQNASTLLHVIMTYKESEFAREQNGSNTGTRKRPSKVDVEQEESLMSMLTELAFRGKSDDYCVGNGRKKKKRREERGFRGTFLYSASPLRDSTDTNEDEVNHNKKVN